MFSQKIEERRRHDLEPLVLGKLIPAFRFRGYVGEVIKLYSPPKEMNNPAHWRLSVRKYQSKTGKEGFTCGLDAILTNKIINDIFPGANYYSWFSPLSPQELFDCFLLGTKSLSDVAEFAPHTAYLIATSLSSIDKSSLNENEKENLSNLLALERPKIIKLSFLKKETPVLFNQIIAKLNLLRLSNLPEWK